ncbi:hypothetical protein RVX_R18150 [Nitratidesulfovibrio sp. HK-II]|uniref:hypothetical protein n=2 Tax=Nitratidesulfovibrio TaxID=2802295 RepID=UPI000EE8033B|nr:hypothetical protein [Nitratidesulfovibrio sp. HK-II]GBO96147.1 hypothetical protein RVX_1187 [Nitratidesulfovibrio sp. HK-II]
MRTHPEPRTHLHPVAGRDMIGPMIRDDSKLFDPLSWLLAHDCKPEILRDADGRPRRLLLHHDRRGAPAPERVARATMIAERFKHLILLQLDVKKGERPRSVRWLLAHGLVELKGGRYRRPR